MLKIQDLLYWNRSILVFQDKGEPLVLFLLQSASKVFLKERDAIEWISVIFNSFVIYEPASITS